MSDHQPNKKYWAFGLVQFEDTGELMLVEPRDSHQTLKEFQDTWDVSSLTSRRIVAVAKKPSECAGAHFYKLGEREVVTESYITSERFNLS